MRARRTFLRSMSLLLTVGSWIPRRILKFNSIPLHLGNHVESFRTEMMTKNTDPFFSALVDDFLRPVQLIINERNGEDYTFFYQNKWGNKIKLVKEQQNIRSYVM